MLYRKHVCEPWFSRLRDGSKTSEGRLNGGDFRAMAEGDVIEFFNDDDGVMRQFQAEITGKRIYDSIKKFLEVELHAALPSVHSVEEGVQVYRAFFSAAAEQKYGVVSIQIQVLEG